MSKSKFKYPNHPFISISIFTVVDLLGSTNQDCSEIIEEDCLHSNHHLAFFTQLFLDDNKMQVGVAFQILKCLQLL